MRVAGDEEGKGSKAMAIAMAPRMTGKWSAIATKRLMAMAMRVAGKQWQCRQRGQWGQKQGWQATRKAMTTVADGNKGVGQATATRASATTTATATSTAMAMATMWAMMLATRLVGNKEG